MAQVESNTAIMLNHYFLIRKLLSMNISYRDIIELIEEKDINFLIAIEQAEYEIQRDQSEQTRSLSKL